MECEEVPPMSDERAMIDSEATTAGRILQSGELKRPCPPPDWDALEDWADVSGEIGAEVLTAIECIRYEVHENDCLRRQLAQAQAEVERLRREREVLAAALNHVYTCENCECALCPQGAELSYRAYRALGEAMDLLDGEKIVGNVTRFVLYDPDLNAWECQVCRFWWEFEDGDPYEHDMRFCPRCGRWIMREAQQKHS